eukprot:SAG22_NODE_4_length_44774_cov_362.122149_23_plen_191_part_00
MISGGPPAPRCACMGLTADEIERWNRDGYVLIRNVLSQEDLQPLIDDYEFIVERIAADLLAQGRTKSGYAELGFDSRFAAICAEDPTVSTGHLDEDLDIGLATARAQTAGTFAVLKNQRLLRLVAAVLGTDEIGWSPISHVRAKLPERVSPGSNIAAWHQVRPELQTRRPLSCPSGFRHQGLTVVSDTTD